MILNSTKNPWVPRMYRRFSGKTVLPLPADAVLHSYAEYEVSQVQVQCAKSRPAGITVLKPPSPTFDLKITLKQQAVRESMIMDEAGQDPGHRGTFMQSERYKQAMENEKKNITRCCAELQKCLKTWFTSQDNSPLQACSKCKFAFYCSVYLLYNISFNKQLIFFYLLGLMSGNLIEYFAALIWELMLISSGPIVNVTKMSLVQPSRRS